MAGSYLCNSDESNCVKSTVKILDALSAHAPNSGSVATDVVSAADAIMALPAELKLLDEVDNEDAHAGKRVRLASDINPSSAADPIVPPSGPDSDPRTASDPRPSPSPLPSVAPTPEVVRRRITGKSPSCNQWGTMCQVFEIGSPAPSSTTIVDYVEAAFEQQVSPDVEISSEPFSEDPPDAPGSASAVPPLPAVKPSPSLKLGAKLTQNQKKLRRKNGKP